MEYTLGLRDETLKVVWESLESTVEMTIDSLEYMDEEDQQGTLVELQHMREVMEDLMYQKPELGERVNLDQLFKL